MRIIHCMNCMAEMEETQERCPVCGYLRGSRPQPEYALQENGILHGRYLVGNVMGRGGFGITYVGFDLMLSIKVAIKEYFPVGEVGRDATSRVIWNSSVVNREAGCESFIKEARKMARIDQIPEIVRVRDIFMANETAYIVMDFVEGETLKEKLKREGAMDVRDCIRLLLPVIRGLGRVHEQNMIHRDIKPDNIMIQRDGKVRLLDLGAAKELTLQKKNDAQSPAGEKQDTPPSQMVVSNGFSPLEQYTRSGSIGPWTDVYAMCATIWYCLTGTVLPSCLERINHEALPWTEEQKQRIPEKVRAVLEKGLALQTENRIQSMKDLETLLVKSLDEPKPPAPWWKKWKKSLVAAAAVLAGTAAVAVWIGAGSGTGEMMEAEELIAEGTCGENLTWTLSGESGILRINGKGEMENWSPDQDSYAPWYEYRDRITGIEIGDEVTSLGAFAFFALNQVEELCIPGKVSEVGDSFANMSRCKEITVEKNPYFASLDGVLYTADMSCVVRYPTGRGSSYEMPEGVQEVGIYAFTNSQLEQITFADTLESIGAWAFAWNNNLEQIAIPASVTNIEECAFLQCENLKSVTYQGENPEIGYQAFGGCTALETTGSGSGSEGESVINKLLQ